MLFKFIFVDSARNAAANREIVALVGAKGLVAAGSAVGGSHGTEVATVGERGGRREKTKGALLFSSTHMLDMTWEKPDLVFKARFNCFFHLSLEGLPSVLFHLFFISICCFFTKNLPAAELYQLVS